MTTRKNAKASAPAESTEAQPDATEPRVEGTPATDSAAKDEGTFTRLFVVSIKGIPGGEEAVADESFHNANKVSTLQDAINGGFRATGSVELAGQEVVEVGRSKTLHVTYSVPVIRATEDDRLAGEVPSPSSVINEDMGGSTLTERPEHLS